MSWLKLLVYSLCCLCLFSNYSSYVAYNYSVAAGQCNAVSLACNATILPDEILRGRTWFVDDVKRFDGACMCMGS